MPRPSEEEKERFLEYIRQGDDRATAAWRINPEYTGSIFRSMCNPHSPRNYDEEFAVAYDEAVAIRGPLDPNRTQVWGNERSGSTTTPTGHTKAMYLTDDQLDEFLEMVRDGVMAWTAAAELDPPTSMTQIHRRAAKDPDFAAEFTAAKQEGYNSYKDKLRAEAARQGFAGDYRALRDQMLMHLEEARTLMTNRHEHTGADGAAIRLFAEQNFAELPKEMLEEMIATLEGNNPERKELPPAPEPS